MQDNEEHKLPSFLPPPPVRGLSEVQGAVQRPRLKDSIDNVREVSLATTTAAERGRRRERYSVEAVEERVRHERELEESVEEEARLHEEFLSQNEYEWSKHISIGIKLEIEFFSRIEEGGYRHQACQVIMQLACGIRFMQRMLTKSQPII